MTETKTKIDLLSVNVRIDVIDYSKACIPQTHVWVEKKEIPTARKCTECGNKIHKKYVRDIEKKTGDVLSEWIMTWADYYTCGEDCRTARNRKFAGMIDYYEIIFEQ